MLFDLMGLSIFYITGKGANCVIKLFQNNNKNKWSMQWAYSNCLVAIYVALLLIIMAWWFMVKIWISNEFFDTDWLCHLQFISSHITFHIYRITNTTFHLAAFLHHFHILLMLQYLLSPLLWLEAASKQSAQN